MAISRKEARPYHFPQAAAPIKYITENGFTIIRSSEIDCSVVDSPSECRFQVQSEQGPERQVTVCFDAGVVALVRIRRRVRLAEKTAFWIVCAESYLAQYLWEQNQFPPNDRLTIDELPPDELMLALHWQDRE